MPATIRATATHRCKNCGTHRFTIKSGFCTRCLYCIQKIAKLKKADPSRPSSLNRAIPKGGFVATVPDESTIIHGYGPGYWIEQFEIDRGKIVREFKSRLQYLKETEERLSGARRISHLQISLLYRKIAHWSGCQRKKLTASSGLTALMKSLTPEQMLLLYQSLNEIAEGTSRRWKSRRPV